MSTKFNAYNSRVNPLDRLAAQFANSDKLKKWLYNLNVMGDATCALSCSLSTFFRIDLASGIWLDVIGVIVGQPRSVVDTTKLKIFGFDGDPDSYGFDDGVFSDGSYGTVAIDASDAIYRRMVRARVLKNYSDCKFDDLLRGITILSERTDFTIVDVGSPMQFGVEFGGDGVDHISKTLLEDYELLPVALGVKLTTVT